MVVIGYTYGIMCFYYYYYLLLRHYIIIWWHQHYQIYNNTNKRNTKEISLLCTPLHIFGSVKKNDFFPHAQKRN